MFTEKEGKTVLFVANVTALVLAGVWLLDIGGAQSFGVPGLAGLAGIAFFSATMAYFARKQFQMKSLKATLAMCAVVLLAFGAAFAIQPAWYKTRSFAFLAASVALVPLLALVIRKELIKDKG